MSLLDKKKENEDKNDIKVKLKQTTYIQENVDEDYDVDKVETEDDE